MALSQQRSTTSNENGTSSTADNDKEISNYSSPSPSLEFDSLQPSPVNPTAEEIARDLSQMTGATSWITEQMRSNPAYSRNANIIRNVGNWLRRIPDDDKQGKAIAAEGLAVLLNQTLPRVEAPAPASTTATASPVRFAFYSPPASSVSPATSSEPSARKTTDSPHP